MNNDLKGLCLLVGLIGLSYVALLVVLALFIGVKIMQSMVLIALFCAFLVSLGLNKQVKSRLMSFTCSQFVR
jgi:hypothetical protein